MRRNIVPRGLGIGRYENGRTGADHERAIADGRRLYGCRRRLPAGRRGGLIPAERQHACFLFCHREARFGIPRYAILQASEIVERRTLRPVG